MSKQVEALKLALEAAYLAGFNASGEGYNGEYPFQDHNAHPAQDEGWCQNRDAYIREALADQPAQQQEPVAVMTVLHLKDRTEIGYGPASAGYDLPTGEYKLYTYLPASKPWVGLTDEEKSDLWCESTGRDCVNEDTHVFADSIEAKLRELNEHREKNAQPSQSRSDVNPLTDEQIIQLAQEWPAETNDWASHIDFARAIEAAHGITGETK